MVKLTYQNHKLYLTFPYDEKIIDIVKSLQSAKWDKNKKAWEFPATNVCYEKIKKEFGLKIDEFEKKKKLKLKGYKFNKTMPFKHQKEAIKFVLERFGFEI